MSIFQHPAPYRHVKRLAWAVSFIQFANALEYMAFNPVFAFMAADFTVPLSWSGYVSGLYTMGAVISGFSAFYWLGRINKKRFLIINMVLLGLLTGSTTLTTSFTTLLILRFCAGAIGGTTMAAAIGLLINQTPVNLRGKMFATVIAAFSVVSIAGMPGILFLCTHYGWHPALYAIAVLCLLSVPLILLAVPADRSSEQAAERPRLKVETLLFASANALVQFSPMLLIPVLVPLLIQRLGLSSELLPVVFVVGGVAGYLATKMTGRLLGICSAQRLAIASTLLYMFSLAFPATGYAGPVLFMVLFLGASYSRLVVSSVVTMAFPDDRQRAGFVSLQTSLMHLLTTVAFFLCPLLLGENDMAPGSINRLLLIAGAMAAVIPLYLAVLQKKLRQRERG
nr:MFS transporter [uncultured Erwinia sp.]